MVRGLDLFRSVFADFADNYVIIGGTACSLHEDMTGQTPRATKDIDIILIVEALSRDFVERFWQFIASGGYTERQVGDSLKNPRHQYYRFKDPADKRFPAQIELFSRSLGIISIPEGMHITPIPTDADLSSLSAILLDEAYYHYTLSHSIVVEGVHFAAIESLIALKCKAYIEMTAAALAGSPVDSRHIRKHRNDVFRLVAAAPLSAQFEVPTIIAEDIASFRTKVAADLPDENLVRDMGLRRISMQQLLDRLGSLFRQQ